MLSAANDGVETGAARTGKRASASAQHRSTRDVKTAMIADLFAIVPVRILSRCFRARKHLPLSAPISFRLY
jgi:hypothetical protein